MSDEAELFTERLTPPPPSKRPRMDDVDEAIDIDGVSDNDTPPVIVVDEEIEVAAIDVDMVSLEGEDEEPMPSSHRMWEVFTRRFVSPAAFFSSKESVKSMRIFITRMLGVGSLRMKRSGEWAVFLARVMSGAVIVVSDDDDDSDDDVIEQLVPHRSHRTKGLAEANAKLLETWLARDGARRKYLGPRDPTESFQGALLPFQRHSLGWMLSRERPGCQRGGILADDMGLGKTVQMVGLVSHPVPDAVAEGYTAGNLIVCRASLMEHWRSHVEKFLPTFSLGVYYSAASRCAETLTCDIVITTYGLLSRDKQSPPGPLHATLWSRIILDEAHEIKNTKTKIAVSCMTLQGCSRWCVSGTPLQNKIEEVQALFSFMRIAPFCDFDEWQRLFPCDSKKVNLDVGCQVSANLTRLRLLMSVFCMRRTKTDSFEGQPLLTLPTLTYIIRLIDMTPPERGRYVAVRSDGLLKILQHGAKQNMMDVIVLIMRLRQLCDHPCLLPSSMATAADDAAAVLFSTACCVCRQHNDDAVITKCGHVFCEDCADGNVCPSPECKTVGDYKIAMRASELAAAVPLDEVAMAENSSKTSAVLDIVETHMSSEKIIVFSQWPSLLRVLERHLLERSISSTMLCGDMNIVSRTKSLQRFQTDPSLRVMLLSTMAGGTGLNIVEASICVLVDPWFNGCVDRQAMARVHRIGQTRPVTVIQLAMKGTVEERILTVTQKRKDFMIDGALGTGEAAQFTTQEMMSLLD